MNTVDRKIGSIKFSCISPEEIKNMSAVKIITADTYDDEANRRHSSQTRKRRPNKPRVRSKPSSRSWRKKASDCWQMSASPLPRP